MGDEAKLKILIEAQNKAKAAFDEANKQLEGTNKKFDTVSQKLDKISGKMKSVGTKMSVGLTLPILAGAGAAVNAFSDLSETLNKVEVSFGDNANEVKAWSETSIESMGLAQQSALDAAALFGDMGTGMGQTTQEASKMSTNLTQLGADLASFKNISFDRAQTALTGVYTGETEALKGLGIVMTQANLEAFAQSKGIKKNIKDMTQQEQVQLRYNYVMEKTANAQGDFARTSDGLANKARMTKERTKQLSAEFGEKLAPAMNKLLEVGGKLLDWFSGLSDGQTKAILMIAGFVAALGPAITIIGHLITAIRGIGIALTFLGAHPIILIIIAIVAVIAGLAFLIIKNWDTLKQWFGVFWETIKGWFAAGIAFIKSNWDKILPIILGPLGVLIVLVIKHWDTIKAGFAAAVNFIRSVASALWGFLSGVFSRIGNFIADRFRSAADTVRSIWNGVIGFFRGIPNALGSAFGRVAGALSSPFKGAVSAIKSIWNNSIGGKGIQIPDIPGLPGRGQRFEIPRLYTGVRNFGGGLATVGDVYGRGGEIISMPRGTDVFNNSESKNILRNLADGNFSGGERNITINVYPQNAEATREVFSILDNDNILKNRGFTPNRGTA